MKRRSPELDFQKGVMRYLALALPRDCFVTAFPSEGGRGPDNFKRGARMKAAGLKPGVPDILIIAPLCRPIWLELKSATGRLTEIQKATISALERAQAFVAVCRTLDDVQAALETAGLELLARTQSRSAPLSSRQEARA